MPSGYSVEAPCLLSRAVVLPYIVAGFSAFIKVVTDVPAWSTHQVSLWKDVSSTYPWKALLLLTPTTSWIPAENCAWGLYSSSVLEVSYLKCLL